MPTRIHKYLTPPPSLIRIFAATLRGQHNGRTRESSCRLNRIWWRIRVPTLYCDRRNRPSHSSPHWPNNKVRYVFYYVRVYLLLCTYIHTYVCTCHSIYNLYSARWGKGTTILISLSGCRRHPSPLIHN